MLIRFRRPSPALVIAILALVVAMSGSAFAVSAMKRSGDSLIAKHTLSGNRLRTGTVTGNRLRTGTVTGDRLRKGTVTGTQIADLAWQPLDLINGWQNYNDTLRVPAWALDTQGIVHFRGAIHIGTDQQIATLPALLRPDIEIYVGTTLASAATGRIDIDSDGGVYVETTDTFSDAQAFTSLDGVTFSVH